MDFDIDYDELSDSVNWIWPWDKPEPDLPKYVNWVEDGAVTPVKDQDRCGSCWAFSTIGALEGAHFVKSGELLTFSEQQLIDCDHHKDAFGLNKGCHGGNMIRAFEYFQGLSMLSENPINLMLESDYPYTSGAGDDSADCLYSASKATSVEVYDQKVI